jgi:energy-coupling factor transporter transmembrane protein EcfT
MGSVQQAVERSMALEARAFSAKNEKTSFRDRRFKRKDFCWLIGSIIFSITFGVASWLL